MSLKYQTRLTLVGAGSAGLVIGLIFAALVFLVARSERAALDRDLHLGLDEAIGEMRELPEKPDFQEVVSGHPGLSAALFSKSGTRLIGKGPVAIELHREPPHYVQTGKSEGDRQVVVAISSKSADDRIYQLEVFTLLLWFPLTFAFGLVIWLTSKSMFSPLVSMAGQAASLGERQVGFRLPMTYGGEYDQFTQKLNELLERIEASVGRQEQFAYDAAHELRTPLTIISAHLQERLRAGSLTPSGEIEFQALLSEVERLTTLVNMLLESAKMKSVVENGQADVSACLESSAARWLDRFTDSHIQLEVETEPALVAISASELETVIDNLLSNALRASSAGQKVKLTNRTGRFSESIFVEDEGSGIPEDRVDSIFAPFVRLDLGRNRSQGGMGLGLSICKRLIEDRRGTISVSSSTQGGAVFHIELPRFVAAKTAN